tara:strand:+ start:3886 stop:4023 length:138 start_codon:yes stop_codon:yes gene_type:complete
VTSPLSENDANNQPGQGANLTDDTVDNVQQMTDKTGKNRIKKAEK